MIHRRPSLFRIGSASLVICVILYGFVFSSPPFALLYRDNAENNNDNESETAMLLSSSSSSPLRKSSRKNGGGLLQFKGASRNRDRMLGGGGGGKGHHHFHDGRLSAEQKHVGGASASAAAAAAASIVLFGPPSNINNHRHDSIFKNDHNNNDNNNNNNKDNEKNKMDGGGGGLRDLFGGGRKEVKNILDFSVEDIDGKELKLGDLKGRVVLIVIVGLESNLATINFPHLMELRRKFDGGDFEILLFPTHDFHFSSPSSSSSSSTPPPPPTSAEIKAVVRGKYQADLKLLGMVSVNGANTAPLFSYLKNSFAMSTIPWSFQKFLIDPNGVAVKQYPPQLDPLYAARDIEEMLIENEEDEEESEKNEVRKNDGEGRASVSVSSSSGSNEERKARR